MKTLILKLNVAISRKTENIRSKMETFTEYLRRVGKIRGPVIVLFSLSMLFTGLIISTNRINFPENSDKIEIRGIYGSPNSFWKKNIRLDLLGVNAVFLNHSSINEELMEQAKDEGLRVFAEFPTLNGKSYVDEHPEAWAINLNGNQVEPATWFMGVCPTEPGFRQYRMNELRDLLIKFSLDGVWMDYLHWHAQFEDPEPILPETCFCDHCLTSFQAASGIQIPEGRTAIRAEWILENEDSVWRDWRCTIIAGWVRDFKMIIKQESPGTLLGVFHCPWDDKEFNGARRRNLGLDYEMLRDIVDVFSPMVYHGRMERNPEWVKENIEWFCNRLKIKAGTFPKVWPIVQAHNDPHIISAEEFEKVLRYGSGAKATGVMMFTSNAVAEDEGKTATLKKIYTGWMNQKGNSPQ